MVFENEGSDKILISLIKTQDSDKSNDSLIKRFNFKVSKACVLVDLLK
jgi:hypothetical protein